jgi:ferrous iron transport protein A
MNANGSSLEPHRSGPPDFEKRLPMSGQVLAAFGDPASPAAADLAAASRERSAAAPVAEARTMVQLTTLARNASGVVAGVRVHAHGSSAELDPAEERMALRLIEIGFVQGAQLRVIAFGQPGDDPIGVRVGGRGGVSAFALRRLEASCVWVYADQP